MPSALPLLSLETNVLLPWLPYDTGLAGNGLPFKPTLTVFDTSPPAQIHKNVATDPGRMTLLVRCYSPRTRLTYFEPLKQPAWVTDCRRAAGAYIKF